MKAFPIVAAAIWLVLWLFVAFVSISDYQQKKASFAAIIFAGLGALFIPKVLGKISYNPATQTLDVDAYEKKVDAITEEKLTEIDKRFKAHENRIDLAIQNTNTAIENANTAISMAAEYEQSLKKMIPVLSLDKIAYTNAASLTQTLTFKPSNDRPLGGVTFDLQILGTSDASFENVRTRGSGWMRTPRFSPDRKRVFIAVSPVALKSPAIEITVSAPCSVRITGNRIDRAIDVPFSAPAQ